MTGCLLPALPNQLGQKSGSLAVNAHVNVMKGAIGLVVRVMSVGMRGTVLWRVPAPDRQIEPAAEGDRVVDDNQFLVVARAERQDVVQADLDLWRRRPAQMRSRCPSFRPPSCSSSAAAVSKAFQRSSRKAAFSLRVRVARGRSSQ